MVFFKVTYEHNFRMSIGFLAFIHSLYSQYAVSTHGLLKQSPHTISHTATRLAPRFKIRFPLDELD